MFRYFTCFVCLKQKKIVQPNEKSRSDSLVYHYDIIHKNDRSSIHMNFNDMEYYNTIHKTRSMQKRLPGKHRGCLCL